MKNEFLAQFDTRILKRTLIFLIIAVSLITISLIGKGLNGSPLMVAIYFIGFVLLFYALPYPWQKVNYYFILSMVFIVLFALLWLVGVGIIVNMHLHDKMGEDIAWSIGLACVSGVIASIIGIFTFAKRWQRVPFAGASLSLLVVAIMMSPMMSPPPVINYSVLTVERVLMVLQLLIAIMLFRIGYVEADESKFSKTALIAIASALVLMGVWGFFALIIDVGNDFRLSFWNFQMRLISIIQVIIALITLFAYYKFPRTNNS